MLKKMLIAAVATGFVAAAALPIQFSPAEAAMTCKDAAKMKYPDSWKERRAYKKACKDAWKAAHGKTGLLGRR